MSGGLLTLVTAYLVLVGLLAVLAALGVPCVPALRAGVLVAEVLLVAQLLVDLVSLLRGHRPAELVTHLAYAAVSVALLPVLTARSDDPPTRADHLVTLCGAVAVAVVTVRLHATWAA